MVLAALVLDVLIDGSPRLSLGLHHQLPLAHLPREHGHQSALIGTIYLMVLCALFIVPVGVATAIYLEEYANRDGRLSRPIEVNIQNLAAVPSVVYGSWPGLHRPRPARPRAGAAGRRPHARACSCSRWSSSSAREAIRAVPLLDPRGLPGPRRHPVADDLEAGPAGRPPRHRDRRDPRALARDRRDGAAAGDRRRHFRRASTPRASSTASRPCPSRSSSSSATPTPIPGGGAAAIIVLLAMLVVMNAGAIFLRNRYERKW